MAHALRDHITGASSSNARLTSQVTTPITSTSSSASPSIAYLVSVIKIYPLAYWL
ncbi:TPA: hypothetical protein OZW08_001335 [Escherichia coli]|nr:hypothetical protein [Escherichia coli]